ncbi:hypothetical protein [Achromobacter sp. NFACC18-2]|uniref:hypothetical protein n=1 Tax=Achromobacter sp. NFACC18-2 TaxID=1564112 RepID=UPI0008CCED12|nr:hypothetical protein [Achromobacter sp. NFACC18-2]SEI78547.1 hypothetical protein SAMN03159494_00992 [Achromobacter sp. NFACC18-2]
MPRSPDEIIAASKARTQASTKLRRMGYRFAKKAATEAEAVAAIHRITGWPLPERGATIEYLQRFASMPEGVPAPSRQHDALHAPEYQPDRWIRAAAARAAQAQRPLVHAVSRIENRGGTEA